MESMIENPRPTRAETNDVANAVFDGADAIMLSAESASGKFPVQAVQQMSKTIQAVEGDSRTIYSKFQEEDSESSTRLNDLLIRSACRLADNVEAKALIVPPSHCNTLPLPGASKQLAPVLSPLLAVCQGAA